MPGSNTEKVLEVLRPFLKEHTPKVLQSHNGGKFTNARMKELLDKMLATKAKTKGVSTQAQVPKIKTISVLCVSVTACDPLC